MSNAVLSSPMLPRVTRFSLSCFPMEHDHWQLLSEPHERLRWARVRWQVSKKMKPEMAAAADALGMKPSTYRAFERSPESSKHIVLDHRRAITFGQKFRVSWQWLLTGEGSPDALELSEQERRIIDALRDKPEHKQAALAEAVEQVLKSA